MPRRSMRKPAQLKRWAVKHRWYDKTLADLRTEHKHDVDKITYRRAFRKLADKTQALAHLSEDSFRSRLTHTLEVSQIAENFSEELRLNEELTEAIALAHDLGHAPFAHAGQETLNGILQKNISTALMPHLSTEDTERLIHSSFAFRHSHNSRRILQRKMRGISKETLSSVVGHSWSPWKGCAWLDSLSDVKCSLERPLAAYGKKYRYGSFLRCYEAQAVAISDQIAALSGDVEDLAVLQGGTDDICDAILEMLYRLNFRPTILERIRRYLERWVTAGSDPEGWDKGWGRKARVRDAVQSVVASSRGRVRRCEKPEASVDAPLVPAAEVAIALDVLDWSVREMISNHPQIKDRNLAAQNAIEVMFVRLLRMHKNPDQEAGDKDEASFRERMREHFQKWLARYRVEVRYETDLRWAISHPGMRAAVVKAKGPWEEVEPVVAVVDYISEMTDRFVIEEVFRDDTLQPVLRLNFGRRVLGSQ
jgi:dGTP triphosphohydrolase